jgi:glycosyltransferase involved in cell wall biosynthesis
MKRLCIISLMEGFPWGGSEELWYQLALRALDGKHELLVCVKEWNDTPPKIKELQSKGARLVFRSTAAKPKGWNLFGKKAADPEVWLSEIKKYDPDFIFVSQGGTFDVLRRTQLVNYLAQRTDSFALLSQFNFEHTAAFTDEMKRNFETINGRWRKFYFVAARNRQVAEQQCGTSLQRTAIVDNPVNLKSKDALPWPAETQLRLACVARYQFAMKGQDKLVHAISSLPSSRAFTLDFYGEGPDKQALTGLVAASPYSSSMRVNGHSGNIDELWSTHHAMILPSLAEGTPLSVQEAMYKGRPVLATDVGDCAKLVIDGKTGFLSANTDTENLQRAFTALLNTSGAELMAMGIAAREHIVQTIHPDSASVILGEIVG